MIQKPQVVCRLNCSVYRLPKATVPNIAPSSYQLVPSRLSQLGTRKQPKERKKKKTTTQHIQAFNHQQRPLSSHGRATIRNHSTPRVLRNLRIRARQVQHILRIPCRIPLCRNAQCRTSIQMILRDSQAQLLWGLHKRRTHAGSNMPLNMAMEEDNAWVVRREAQHNVARPRHKDGVATHGHGLEFADVVVPGAGVCGTAVGELRLVTVCVEGVGVFFAVVDHQLDRGVVGEYHGVGVDAVYYGVRGLVAYAERCVERWNLLVKVCDVVEESSVGGALDYYYYFGNL